MNILDRLLTGVDILRQYADLKPDMKGVYFIFGDFEEITIQMSDLEYEILIHLGWFNYNNQWTIRLSESDQQELLTIFERSEEMKRKLGW